MPAVLKPASPGLGRKIRSLRVKAKMSQPDLATALGISIAAVSQYERGKRTPSWGTIKALAKAFQCQTDFLA